MLEVHKLRDNCIESKTTINNNCSNWLDKMFKDLKEYQEITRIYHESVNISEEQEKNSFLICRGPDEYKCIHGKFSDYFKNDDNNNLIYQFNRLAILDLSDSASQPMVSQKFKTILMFNGEQELNFLFYIFL